MPKQPLDINKELGLDSFSKEETTVVFESDPSKTPEQFKELPREID
jgi:hypothetical protein